MPRVVEDVTPSVRRIAVGPEGSPGQYPPNVFLVTGSAGAVFVDTAYGNDDEVETALDAWRAGGSLPVAAIVLSHRHSDHIGGARRLREATGGRIVAHADELKGIEEHAPGLRVDAIASDGERLDLGGVTLEYIDTPGHTMGSICVLHHEDGLLLTGDTILGGSTTAISPDQGDMGLYVESLHRLLSYDARTICPGHGPIIRNPRAKIEKLIEHRQARERKIVDLLEGGAETVEQLFAAMYSGLKPALHDSARSQIRTHLKKLERDGRVRAGTDGTYRMERTS